jgi:hypothetical protein
MKKKAGRLLLFSVGVEAEDLKNYVQPRMMEMEK